MNSVIRRSLGLLALAVLTFAFAAPVSASGVPLSARGGAAQHCVMNLEAVPGRHGQARIATTTCFRTFAEALNHATGGFANARVGLQPKDVTSQMLPASTLTSVVLGIDYQYSNYNNTIAGWTATWTASSGCTSSLSWTVSNVGSRYNDQISSAKAFSNCNKYHHYEHENYGGAVLTCRPNCDYMGVMDNQTTSLSWDF